MADVVEIERSLVDQVSRDDFVLIETALQELIAPCMREHGWEWTAPGVSLAEIEAVEAQAFLGTEVWTFDDVTVAASSGYGLEEARRLTDAMLAAQSEAPVNPDLPPDQAEARDVDYFGTDAEQIEITEQDGGTGSIPGGGCYGAARRAIYGSLADYATLSDALRHVLDELSERTRSHGAVVDAAGAWSTCMEQAGFQVDTPDLTRELAASDPGAEIEIATADASCNAETDLAATYAGVYYEAYTDLSAQFEAELVAYREMYAAAADRARQILGIDP